MQISPLDRSGDTRWDTSVPEHSHPDAALLGQVANGDQAAFRELNKAHVARLIAIARRMLKDPSEAEDIAQETLVRLWRRAGELEVSDAGIGPWLNRVAANLCLDRLRRLKPQDADALETLSVAAEQTTVVLDGDRRRVVADAMDGLPERQRMALNLFQFEGFSLRETAAALEVSSDAIESLLARARRQLKVTLADRWRELIDTS